jgi:hypothetical protein
MLKRGVCWKHAGERRGEYGHLRLVCMVTDLIITRIITSVYMNESRQSRGKRVHSPHRQVPCICPHDPLQQPRLYCFMSVHWHVLKSHGLSPGYPGPQSLVALRISAPFQTHQGAMDRTGMCLILSRCPRLGGGASGRLTARAGRGVVHRAKRRSRGPRARRAQE